MGRLGCFFNQCCYGSQCDLPWAIYQHDAWRHPAAKLLRYSTLLIGPVPFEEPMEDQDARASEVLLEPATGELLALGSLQPASIATRPVSEPRGSPCHLFG